MSLLIGTSGWSYDDWVGPFYQRRSGKFTRYREVFHTGEINSTFYRYPSEGLVTGLIRNSSPGFVFAAKLPGEITHDKWLDLDEGVEDDTWRFLEIMRPLAEKLGPILIQLRPKFSYEEHVENLEDYLEVIPSNFDWAVEFRDNSWLRQETFDILKKNKVAYTIVDEPLLPPEVHITADFSYIRWHGHGTRLWYDYEYSTRELEEWVPKVEEVESETRRTYGYFNNHFRANAAKNAIEFLEMMDMASEKQLSVLQQIKDYRASKGRPSNIQPLDSFTPEEGLSVSDLLIHFTTASRLSRAEKMADDEVEFIARGENSLEAEVRRYNIKIDVEGREIEHNCADWRKGTSSKRFCKHMDKLFLMLPEDEAKRILNDMIDDKDKWRFEFSN